MDIETIHQTDQSPRLSHEFSWPEDMGKALRQWGVICLMLGALGAAAAGCAHQQENPREGWTSYGDPIHTIQVADNIWAIPTGYSYVDSLAQFTKDHPELRVVSSDIGGQYSHGFATYHVVITEPAAEK